jgi:anthranilate phosphoribosyltransferase
MNSQECLDNSATNAVDFRTKKIKLEDGQTANITIWEILAGESFKNSTNLITRNVKGWFVITDASDSEAIEDVKTYKEIIDSGKDKDDIPKFLIGNK